MHADIYRVESADFNATHEKTHSEEILINSSASVRIAQKALQIQIFSAAHPSSHFDFPHGHLGIEPSQRNLRLFHSPFVISQWSELFSDPKQRTLFANKTFYAFLRLNFFLIFLLLIDANRIENRDGRDEMFRCGRERGEISIYLP